MNPFKIPASLIVEAPANWRGTYICPSRVANPKNKVKKGEPPIGSWSWYKDGDSYNVRFPHVTISRARHEIAGSYWAGFHVSYPVNGQNARANYSVTTSDHARYENMSTTGLDKNIYIELDALVSSREGESWIALFDAFAEAFVRAASAAETARLPPVGRT